MEKVPTRCQTPLSLGHPQRTLQAETYGRVATRPVVPKFRYVLLFSAMVLAGPDRPVKRSLLSDRCLLLVIELAGCPVDVDMPIGSDMLIALNGAVLRFPFELAGIRRVKLSVQWCIVPLMLSGCVDALPLWLLVQALRAKCVVTAAVVHGRFPSFLLCWLLLAEIDRRGLRGIVAEPLA